MAMAWTNCRCCICRTRPIAFGEVTGKGKDKITFDYVPVAEATKYSAEDADVTLRLHMLLKPLLTETRKSSVYETLERPLVMVLKDMERAGVTINPDLLRRLSNDFGKTQAGLETQIRKLAGEEFNIGSPKQLGDILSGKMGMEGGRKTKTGAWSTDVYVLEEVAAEGHDIAKKVSGMARLGQAARHLHRRAARLYQSADRPRAHVLCDGVHLDRAAGLHRSQSPEYPGAHRGRPADPPQAFIAAKGNKLISADWRSQIELRLLAHIANIPQLKKPLPRTWIFTP